MFVYNCMPAGVHLSRSRHLVPNDCVNRFLYLLRVTFYTIIMADSDRIVFPDEVEDAKAAAADAQKDVGGESNSIETPPEQITITPRNVIQAPSNCPEGFKRGPDGVCREVF